MIYPRLISYIFKLQIQSRDALTSLAHDFMLTLFTNDYLRKVR